MDQITKVIHKHFKKVSDGGLGFLNTNMKLAIEDLDNLLNSAKDEERERCAKIAEVHRYSCSEMTYRDLIAKAIRK